MNKQHKILVIDDERAIRNTLDEILSFEGYHTDLANDGVEGLNKLTIGNYDCVLCDIKMPKIDGLEVFQKAHELYPSLPFILISGHATIEEAVDAVKAGAYDFIAKPPDLNRLLITVKNAIAKKDLVAETKDLKRKIRFKDQIIGTSPYIQHVLSIVDRVAPTDARVLIIGENGTGKELIAHRIYELSNRSKQPLVEVNCAAIHPELIESELFGHEKGAFTSAIKQRIGKFEQADGGTLFLDEIGDMSLAAQAKVLRVLEEGEITRLGSNKVIKVNVRIIAATNKELRALIKEGLFREDLYHRLNVISIKMPTLAERPKDIPELTNHFLTMFCNEYNMPQKTLEATAMKALVSLPWTGNIRQLKNVIERLVILGENKITLKNVEEYVLGSLLD